MKLRYLLVIGMLSCQWAHAEIYKRVDADGNVTYSNTPLKGAKKLHLAPLPTFSVESEHSGKPAASFPKIDVATQKQRDLTRQKILEDELSSEEKALAEARIKLQSGAENPEAYIDSNGKAYRDIGKQEKKMSDLQEHVVIHEKNIAALKTELANAAK